MIDKDILRDSYPYVTGMGFRKRSHMIFDEFQKDNPDKINKNGQVVFIKTDYVLEFFSKVLPLIDYQIKIITHNSSYGIDSSYSKFLNNKKVIHWYAQNANFEHKKLTSIPLGIANRRWPHGNIDVIDNINKLDVERSHLVYMNFDVNTNLKERSVVYNNFIIFRCC